MLVGRVLMAMVVAITLMTGLARAATPEDREQARQHYENATRKFDTGRYEEAAAEFQRVFDLIGDPALLYNIAQAYRAAKKYDKALLFYRSFLRRNADASNRAEVESRIAELTELVKTMPPPKVEPPRSEAPAPAQVEARAPQPEPQPQAKPRDRKPLRIAGFALCGLGVAGLAVGGAMSGLTVSAGNDLTRVAAMHGEFTSGLQSDQSLGPTYQTLSIVGYAVGGAAAIAGVALLAVGYRHERAPVSVAVGLDRVVLTGRF